MTTGETHLDLNDRIQACEACPRLRAHGLRMATVKTARYRDQTYHGRPVANFGDPAARILLLGLAPGAHGANRTGRMFTGDRSGDFLFAALHRAGLANQPDAVHRDDGLTLHGVMITAACHCAPPDNKPSRDELQTCSPFLDQTVDLLADLKVIVALGRIAFDAAIALAVRRSWIASRGGRTFAHDAWCDLGPGPILGAAYHPSQQNTFTGRLTPDMLLAVLVRAARDAGLR